MLVIKNKPDAKSPGIVCLTAGYLGMSYSIFVINPESYPILSAYILPIATVYFIGIRISIFYSGVFCGILLWAFWGKSIFPNFPEYSQIFAIKFLSSYIMVCLLSFSLEGLRFKASKRVERLAYQDSLTGLSNRLKLLQTLQGQGEKAYACVYVDLDDFSQINQLFGQKVSDKILQKFSENMRYNFTESVCVARLYADEFCLVFSNCNENYLQEKIDLCKEILADIAQVWTESLALTASFGVAIYPNHANTPESILHRAQLARSQAKRLGKNQLCYFDSKFAKKVERRVLLEKHLKLAISYKELEVHFQPKINPNQNQVVGMESLIRWRNKQLGWISPVEFIPIAEESGLILPIGEWVLIQSLDHIQNLYSLGFEGIVVSVNISPRQFYQKNLFEKIMEMLMERQLPPESLELEITEGILIQDDEEALQLMQKFRRVGIQLALDDFGTGYSSLSYLKKYRFDTLKIDKSFIDAISLQEEERNLVETFITLANHMKMTTVAEGVETEDQLGILRDLGCEQIQGWFYSKALPDKKFIEYLDDFSKSRT
jgi:diguanylate cyclase (GGDEF)-like protein